MSKNLQLKSFPRTENVKTVRKNNFIPGIFYGKGRENKKIQLNYHDFRRIFEKAGYNTIIDLDIDGQKEKVMIYDIDIHPIKNTFTHVDLHAIKMDEEITATVPIKFIGVSPAIKDLGGILVHAKTEIEIECLPKDLIHEIEIDISVLTDFHSSVAVSNLQIPETVKILDNPESIIVTVSAPRKTIEEEEAEAAAKEEAAAASKEKEEAPKPEAS